MDFLDTRTVILSTAISGLIYAAVLFSLWKQNRNSFNGLAYWWINYGLLFLGMVLFSLRGIVSDFLSIVFANAIIVGGNLLLLIGLEHFLDKRRPQIYNYILLAVFIGVDSYFTYQVPSLFARNILTTGMLFIYVAQIIWLALFRVNQETRRFSVGVGISAMLFCFISLIRIGVDLVVPTGNEFLHSNIFETSILLAYQMINIVVAFNLILMVNRRLDINLEKDLQVRAEVESALRLSEEKFSKAFKLSPDAVLITRLADGKFIDVNEGFSHLSGYTREEALAGTTIAFGVWEHPEDRNRALGEIRATSKLRNFETEMHLKSGKTIKVILSGEMLTINHEECAIWVIRDITEIKQAEAILHLRLHLWEYSTSHTAPEVMQKALDEIEALTGSQIGFYHFVHSNSQTLTLQAWSTKTSEEFCRAAVGGTHSPISEAGVWADCVRERKPIIHNDYPGLAHRKGLPEGHASITREVMVPTIRNGQVVSVLGVGNKPEDYTEKDVEVVSYIADMVWEIVSQKQATEQIRTLNIQLENLAMKDELTGLTNRRAFFIRGIDEINKTKRYHPPLSVIMLDIDRFKSINDTYGHEAGDMALQCIASILLENVRVVDVAARLGGEEFAILLPSTTAKSAAILAERLRKAIADQSCLQSEKGIHVTASFGVAEYGNGMQNLDDLLRNADEAMYQAKNRGRNQVVIHD